MNSTWEDTIIEPSIHECDFDWRHGPGNYTNISIYWIPFGIFITNILLAVVSVIAGIAAWILVDRWRKFKNYVFLNVITISTISMIVRYMFDRAFFHVNASGNNTFLNITFSELRMCNCLIQIALILTRLAASHWMLVVNVTFFKGIVNIFQRLDNLRQRDKYLIINLFTWVAPMSEGALLFTVVFILDLKVRHIERITIGIACFCLVINAVMYLRVLYALITLAYRKVCPKRNACLEMALATVASVTSGIFFYIPLFLVHTYTQNVLVLDISMLVGLFFLLVVIVFFLAMPSHRLAWQLRRQPRQRREPPSSNSLDKMYFLPEYSP